MITGDSHKGYGQNLFLFGTKKGSGESVWDIKKQIGYFTPAMTDTFKGYHRPLDMLISGLHDSVGLYVKPTDAEVAMARNWLDILGLRQKENQYFNELGNGEKRLLMVGRAMIKHPPLLILDEPTAALDTAHAHFFVNLVNQFAKASNTALIYVSHRQEPGLKPQKILELKPTPQGSTGSLKALETQG